MKAQGKYYDGKTASSEKAEMQVWGSNVELILESGEKLFYHRNQLEVESRLGTSSRKINLPNESRFSTDDHAFVDQYLKRNKLDLSYHLESNTKLVIGSLGGFMATLLLCYFVILPGLSSYIAPLLPKNIPQSLGDETEDFLLKNYFLPKTNVSVEKIEKLSNYLETLKTYVPGKKLNLIVLSSPKIGPNAFALPNGSIIVTDQLIEKSESMEEVYAVLLHEIGHIYHHHSMERLISSSVLSFLVFVIIGPVDWMTIPIVLMLSSYSRKAETQADSFATFKLIHENKDPLLLTRLLSRMKSSEVAEQESSIPNLLLSHPLTSEREENILKWKNNPQLLPYEYSN